MLNMLNMLNIIKKDGLVTMGIHCFFFPHLPWVSVKMPNPNEHAALAHTVNAGLFPPLLTVSL